MTKYIDTLLILAEASEEDFDDNAEYEREAKVEAVLRSVVAKLGLEMADGRSIMYSDSDREAILIAYDEVTLEQLKALESVGYDIRVSANASMRDCYQITFLVAEGVENAQIN